MKHPTLLLTALSMLLLTACPPNRGDDDDLPPGGGGSSEHWLAVTELFEGEAAYTSHSLLKVTGGSMSCNAFRDYYTAFTESYLARTEAVEALEDQWGGPAWSEVEFVRAYCEIDKALYEELGDAQGYTRAGRTALGILTNHPDAFNGEPQDGTYALETGMFDGEDPPEVGRGGESYGTATQTEYLRNLVDVYADVYDCDIESASDPYYDNSAFDDAWINHQVSGTLEITDASDSSVRAEITDGELIDQNSEPDGEFSMSKTTFTLCEVEFESPFGGPETDPVPGR